MQWRGLPCPIPRSDRSLSKPRALSAEPEPSLARVPQKVRMMMQTVLNC